MLFSHGHGGNAIVFTVADAIMQMIMPCPLIPDDYARLYRIWLLQAKDDPWYDKMQQGQTPKWFLRSEAILFTDVEAKDVVVSTGSARNGMPGGGLGRVSRCMDLRTNFSTGLRTLAKRERRNRCKQTRMWKGLLRGCPCRRWSGGLQMKRGDVTLEIMTVMTLLTINDVKNTEYSTAIT